MNKYLIISITIISMTLSGVSYASWQQPSTTPTGGNTLPPINSGAVPQTKSGGLIINSGGSSSSTGLRIISGSIGIGVLSPSQLIDVSGDIRIQGADGLIFGNGKISSAPPNCANGLLSWEPGWDCTQVFDLSVTKSGNGSGSVTSDDDKIDCGDTCDARYIDGKSVTLTASPAAGSEFDRWGGACSGTSSTCNVTMDQTRNVTAIFSRVTHTLAVTKLGDGSGTVASNDGNINCGSNCSADYNQGTNVRLTATPSGNSSFDRWGGDCSGTSSTCNVSMNGDRNVTATFIEDEDDDNGDDNGAGGGGPQGHHGYGSGTENYIPVWVSTANNYYQLGNSTMYQNAGRIGINTTNPNSTLHVFQPDEDSFIRIGNGTTGINTWGRNVGLIAGSGPDGISISAGKSHFSVVTVGGNTNADARLHVRGDNSTGDNSVAIFASGTSNQGTELEVRAYRSAATSTRHVALQVSNVGSSTGRTLFLQPDGGNMVIGNMGAVTSASKLLIDIDGWGGNSNHAVYISSARGTGDHRVPLGIYRPTTTNNTHLTTYYSDVGSGSRNEVAVVRASGHFDRTSDIRTKTDIVSIENSLDKVLALRPVYYRNIGSTDTKRNIGLIAQEVELHVPELVSKSGEDGAENDMLMLNYDGFSVMLIRAVQEQQEYIDDLRERVKKLENR